MRSGGWWGESVVNLAVLGRYEDTVDSVLIQAGLNSVLEGMGIHLETIMDYTKLSQEQPFFSKSISS